MTKLGINIMFLVFLVLIWIPPLPDGILQLCILLNFWLSVIADILNDIKNKKDESNT